MRMSHTRLLVHDFKAVFRFYRDAMGLPVLWGEETGIYADFDANGHVLALFDRTAMAEAVHTVPPPCKSGGQDEVCLVFAVDDVDAAYERMRGMGIETLNRPHDRKEWGIRCFHLRDPEGFLIEVNKETGMGG